jgi:SAM-dependent methyltransferase
MPSAVSPPQATSSLNYTKYQSRNPVVRRLIARFLDRVVALTAAFAPRRIVDLGCGDGEVASTLRERLPFDFEYRGIEINPLGIALARQRMPGIDITLGDLLTLEPQPGWADLAVCFEVIEHLADPPAAVERIRLWTARHALVSVPWEPYFRVGSLLRGKYLRTLGNHPEHVQHFDPASLRALLAPHFQHVQIERCFPWLIAVASADAAATDRPRGTIRG